MSEFGVCISSISSVAAQWADSNAAALRLTVCVYWVIGPKLIENYDY